MGAERAELPAERIGRIYRRMAEVEGSADSEDGLVSVVTGARGELVELWLDPRIYRDPDAGALAEEIVRTVHAAIDSGERKGFDAAAELLPPGSRPDDADLAFDPVLYQFDRMIGK